MCVCVCASALPMFLIRNFKNHVENKLQKLLQTLTQHHTHIYLYINAQRLNKYKQAYIDIAYNEHTNIYHLSLKYLKSILLYASGCVFVLLLLPLFLNYIRMAT